MNDGMIVAITGIALTAVIGLLGFLGARVLLQVDKNQTSLSASLGDLWKSHDKLSEDFHEVKGAHRVNHPQEIVHVHHRTQDEK